MSTRTRGGITAAAVARGKAGALSKGTAVSGRSHINHCFRKRHTGCRPAIKM